MDLNAIYAHLDCDDLDDGIRWFSALFGRAPDARPMEGLAEWHHGDATGFQLFLAPDHAGHGTVTLMVEDIAAERERLRQAGIDVGNIEDASVGQILRLDDPDDNLVVLVQPAA